MKNIPGKPALIQLKFFLFKAKSLIAFCAANGEQKWQENLLDRIFNLLVGNILKMSLLSQTKLFQKSVRQTFFSDDSILVIFPFSFGL